MRDPDRPTVRWRHPPHTVRHIQLFFFGQSAQTAQLLAAFLHTTSLRDCSLLTLLTMSSTEEKTPNVAPKEDDPAPPPVINGPTTTGAQVAGQNDTAAAVGVSSEVKPENSKAGAVDIEYPTGVKLALLMTSIFVGMFLVSLVCSHLSHIP